MAAIPKEIMASAADMVAIEDEFHVRLSLRWLGKPHVETVEEQLQREAVFTK